MTGEKNFVKISLYGFQAELLLKKIQKNLWGDVIRKDQNEIFGLRAWGQELTQWLNESKAVGSNLDRRINYDTSQSKINSMIQLKSNLLCYFRYTVDVK